MVLNLCRSVYSSVQLQRLRWSFFQRGARVFSWHFDSECKSEIMFRSPLWNRQGPGLSSFHCSASERFLHLLSSQHKSKMKRGKKYEAYSNTGRAFRVFHIIKLEWTFSDGVVYYEANVVHTSTTYVTLLLIISSFQTQNAISIIIVWRYILSFTAHRPNNLELWWASM